MAKDMLFNDDARQAIFRGVQKLARAVKATLGPTGRNVVIKKDGKPPIITKDGVTVAMEVSLDDYFENLGVELIREVASKTATSAGDGTTTATVLAEAILEIGARYLDSGVNASELKIGIDAAIKVVAEHITWMAKPVTSKEEIFQVATISANNDKELGKLISDLVHEIGAEGVATIEKTATSETTVEKVDGVAIGGGFVSPYFITQGNEAAWDNPRILIYDGRITAARDLIVGNGTGFLEKVVAGGNPLVIIAEGIDGEALHALVMNRVQGHQKFLAVKIPFTPQKSDLLQDIAILTGGKVFSKEAGHKLHKIDLEDLGRAERVVATATQTLILRGGGARETIKARAQEIQEQAEKAHSDLDKKFLRERASKLEKGIAIIRVGGASEVELQERYYRVEDALYATQAAVAEGIVPGGGVSLVRCIPAVRALAASLETEEQRCGARIVEKALAAPLKQIAINAGKSGDVVLEKVLAGSGAFGYNARTNVYGDLYEAGVVDPAKVSKTVIQNAASVAGLVLTTDVLLVERPKETPPPAQK